VLSVQILQKETHLHENKRNGRHKYVEMLNQDNDNQNERNYILSKNMEMNGNPTYKHGMDAKKKNKDTRKYVENHNQEYD
jgi:ankyrin repeat protein